MSERTEIIMDEETNKRWLLKHLKSSVNNNGVRLPNGVSFKLDDEKTSIWIRLGRDTAGKCCASANMQTDGAAFEGWALVIRAHIPSISLVSLEWEAPSDIDGPHYQRFLYRVDRFTKIFKEWFVCKNSYKDHLKICNDQTRGFYKLNVPTKERTNIPLSVKKWSERWLERSLVANGEPQDELRKKTNIKVLGNQLPVGVFRGEVSRRTAVFTGQASAIDLWGVNAKGDELSLFELKKPGNSKVGVLSELFFYAMVMKDVIDGRFAFSNDRYPGVDPWPTDYISKKIRRIKAYLLVDKLHCLVSKRVLDVMNRALVVQGIFVEQLWVDALGKGKDK